MKALANAAQSWPAFGFRHGLKARVWMGILLGATLAFIPNLRAEWYWEKTEATSILSGDKIQADFTFRNAGTKPVTVNELKFSCSCLEFSFTATTAAPGSTGTLTVFLARSEANATWQLVAFGPEGTTPGELTIRPAKLLERSSRTAQ